MNVRRRFSFGVAWMFMGSWVEQFLNFAIFIALARLLDAEIFGVAAMAAALVILSEALVRETLTEPLIARKDVEPGHLDAVFWLLAGLSLVITLALVSGAGLISSAYGDARVEPVLQVFAISILLTGLTAVPIAQLRRDMAFQSLAIRQVAGAFAGGVVGIWMAWVGYGVWALVGQRIALLFVDSLLVWMATTWRPAFRATRAHFRDVRGFGSKVLGLTAAEIASVQTPVIVIGLTLGATPLGHFQMAWRLTEIASFLINTPFRMVAQPAFAKLRHSGESAVRLLEEIAQLSTLIALSAFAGLAILAEPVVTLMLGPGWEETAPVLQVLSLVGAYLCIERVQYAFCLAAGRAGKLALLALGEAVFGVIAIWIVVDWGIVAVALAFALRYYLLWPLRFRLVQSLGGIGLLTCLKLVAPAAIGAAVMALAVRGALHVIPASMPAPVILGGGALIGVAVFVVFVMIFLRGRVRTAERLIKGME